MTPQDTQELHDDYVGKLIEEYESWRQPTEHDLPQWFRDTPTLYPYRCPRCHGVARWRSGQEFEHMMRCGKCGICWTPSAVLEMNEVITEGIALMFGGGI